VIAGKRERRKRGNGWRRLFGGGVEGGRRREEGRGYQ
jgi:hypothetical protein